MASPEVVINSTMHAVSVMEEDGVHVKAYIDTVGVDIDGFTGYISEVRSRMLSVGQLHTIRKLGGFSTSLLGLNHSTLLIPETAAPNFFPDSESVEEINALSIGNALKSLLFDGGDKQFD